jgi:hypothetical protein
MPYTFPILLKEGWPDHFIIMILILIPAGVVDFHNSASAEVGLFLRDDLKNLLLSKRFWFFMPIKVRRN